MGRTTAKHAMIASAERIAAERGLGAMSLRDVQTAAGQRNKSAARYHFGDRLGLLAAVVDRRMTPINERRLEWLAELDDSATRRDLVEALVLPLAEAVIDDPDSYYARFLVQALFDPSAGEVIEQHLSAGSFIDVRARLINDLDHLPDDIAKWRVSQVIASLVTTLAAIEAGTERAAGRDRISDLVETSLATLGAPPASPVPPPGNERVRS